MQPAPQIHPQRPPFSVPADGRARLCRFPRALAAALLLLGPALRAQTVSTVRETEFRSRWVNQGVDRPQLDVGPGIPTTRGSEGFGDRTADSLRSLFRNGPVVIRAGLTAGIEYNNQRAGISLSEKPSESSFFVAPLLAAIYEREVGPWEVSARYSVGYVYYFDQTFFAAGGSPGTPDQTVIVETQPARPERTELVETTPLTTIGGIRRNIPQFRVVTRPATPAVTEEVTIPGTRATSSGGGANLSQSAGLDFQLTLSRLTVRSSGSASSGTGFDTENGRDVSRLSISEAITADYQLTEYTRAGVRGSYSFSRDATPGSTEVTAANTSTRYEGAVYGDYFLTGKSQLRLELNSGHESQSAGGGLPAERTYTQAIARMTFQAAAKLTLEGSLGVGLVASTGGAIEQNDGLRSVYSLTASYSPTQKISARLYFGLETTATQPEVSLSLEWRPRDSTVFRLSAYQLTGVSLLSFTQNRITRGFLGSVSQRLGQRLNLNLSTGWEQIEDLNQTAITQDPYLFVSGSLSFDINQWLAFEAQARTSTGGPIGASAGNRAQTRASASFRLTF